MKVTFGKREMTYDPESGPISELRSSNDLLDDPQGLRNRLDEDGYLLIRGLLGRENVLNARRVVVNYLQEMGRIAPDTDPMEARINPEQPRGLFLGGRQEVTHHPDFLRVLEGPEAMGFYERLFGEAPLTFSYKWLRAVEKDGSSNAHYDAVYMGRGTLSKLLTMWTPLGDVPLDHGPLALCVGSHNEPGFEKLRETYGKMDVDRDRVQGWFSDDPVEINEKFGGRWKTTAFEAGDALIFGMFTMHGSLKNQRDAFRISSDSRYQPASEPADERWVGAKPKGHYAWMTEPEKMVSMEEARAQWGV
jgi:hypothetical protein